MYHVPSLLDELLAFDGRSVFFFSMDCGLVYKLHSRACSMSWHSQSTQTRIDGGEEIVRVRVKEREQERERKRVLRCVVKEVNRYWRSWR